MLFDQAVLRRETEPHIFAKGREYFLDGAVEDLQILTTKDGSLSMSGYVTGSQRYHTKLVLSPDQKKISFFECTCPYQWDVCKHVVALGLQALANAVSPGDTANASERMGKVLKEFADEQGIALPKQELDALVEDLAVDKARVVPAKVYRLNLDEIFFQVSYEPKQDRVQIQGFARYGTYTFPLADENVPERYEYVENEQKIVAVVSRLSAHEDSIIRDVADLLGLKTAPVGNTWTIPSGRLLWFITVGLDGLREIGRVELDDEATALVTIEDASIEWNVEAQSTTDIDWFSFSLDWQCRQASLDAKELKEALTSEQGIIRLANGRIVRIQNRDEVASVLEWAADAEESEEKILRVRRYHVPELAFLMQATRHAHVAQTNASFERLIADVSRGALLETPVLSDRLKGILRPYQQEGVAWLAFLHKYGFGGVLADEMGLGKTLQVLAFLSSLRQTHPAEPPVLVVCPKTLLSVWRQELERFTPELRLHVIDGIRADRQQAIKAMKSADVVLTSYSLLQRDLATYLEEKQTFSVCVLDEAHFIKNAKTQTSLVMKTIPAQFRVALTGTPIENGVHEVWSLFDFLMPGFLGSSRHFTEQFSRPIREHQDEQALARLRLKLKPFLLRRTKELVAKELPAKIEQEMSCTLSPEQLVLYTQVLNEVRTEVQAIVQEKGFNRAQIEILAALTKLRRICDHPSFADPKLPGDVALSGKLEATVELIREAVSGGHKILVFSQFTSMLDLVRDALDKEDLTSVTIEGSTRDRAGQIEKFRKDVSVFLLSLKAGGTGLTLTEADTVLLIDPWWNPQVERQAMDRAHRIGQNKPVTVYKLIAQGTIEEKMIELQKKKQHVFDALLEGQMAVGETLTWEDVQAVLG